MKKSLQKMKKNIKKKDNKKSFNKTLIFTK